MEDLSTREQNAESHVHQLLKRQDVPITTLLQAFQEYRELCQEGIFHDFTGNVEKREARLWSAHTQGKRYFHKALAGLRKLDDKPVATRSLIKLYLQFIKDSQRFYRSYVHNLNAKFGGISELEAVAHQVKNDGSGESRQFSTTPEIRDKVLKTCHQALICLGDLSRYRASEQLDKKPDYGPAIGYYGLACTLCPSSGRGHHQQAVVALEQRNHLRAIYHLYRAIVVEHPDPNAANNLRLEFDKVNASWDKGTLLPRASPNDAELRKRTLIGWFVRLQSVCFKGDTIRGYDELELEVLGQIGNVVAQTALEGTLLRLIIVNLAAQYTSVEKFQAEQSQQHQTALLRLFRLNLRTFTSLLNICYSHLKAGEPILVDDDEVDLAARLPQTTRQILPGLRLYSIWLMQSCHLITGLSNDEFLKDSIDKFWRTYAKTIDLIAAKFSIWDLLDVPSLGYMLKEDVDTIGFLPLQNGKSNKIWYDGETAQLRPRYSSVGLQRLTEDEEMLARIRQFLVDGLDLANDNDDAPIKLSGDRILHRDANDTQTPIIIVPKAAAAPNPKLQNPAEEPAPCPRPLSYAAAAANGSVKTAKSKGVIRPNSPASSSYSQAAQLSRMVDDLVDDDDTPTSAVPARQELSRARVARKGNMHSPVFPVNGKMPNNVSHGGYRPDGKTNGVNGVTDPKPSPRSAAVRPKTPNAANRLQAVSSIWDDASAPASAMSSHFPNGLSGNAVGSPPPTMSRGHSRVNSANSIRSKTSHGTNAGIVEPWPSTDSAPRANGFARSLSGELSKLDSPNVASALLFGAGGGLWSSPPQAKTTNMVLGGYGE